MRVPIQTMSARDRSAPDAVAPPLMGPMESRLVLRLLLVCVGYYAGASIGFGLKFFGLTPSVLWTPNAILTATLLLTAPRRWWLYLLAALPAHMAIELTTTLPRSLVLALFLTNCAEAVLAAGLARWVSDAPTRFDTFRRVAAFVVTAGVTAPFLSSFPDATFVELLRGEPYWSVFSTRFPSNVLAELLVVPTIVTAVRAVLERRGPPPPRRLLEMALLGGGLLAVAVVAFGDPGPLAPRNPWSLHTPYALLLPFFLWAAVRFGPGGLSACLLTTALLAIRTGTLEVAVFSVALRGDGVLALQIFLIVVSVPLLCLAAVIEEARQTNEVLQERLAFEGLLSRLSSAFVRLPSPEMDRAFETWLTNVGGHLRSGALALLELAPSGDALTLRFGSPPPRADVPRALASRDFPWIAARLREERPVVFGSLDALPAEAARERAMLAEHGVCSGAILPLEAGGRVLGGLAYLASGPRTGWPAQLESRLQLVGEVFANALARRGTEDALRASEEMKSAVLASLRSGVAVLDRDGTVIAVNEGWSEHAAEAGVTSASRAGLGDNYLMLWRQAQFAGNVQAAHAVVGIEAVLNGRRERFAFEYTCHDPMPERWFALSAVPLHRSGSGAVISNTEITDWKRAELEAQRSRQELAHFTRVSTMGALAASLAHELNQPLTGILANAQAARRFLAVTPPDLDEIRGILADIVEDDKRAGEVIERLRELLRKGDAQTVVLDANALVRDVVRLVSSDALIRGTRLEVALRAMPSTVRGDRIQLQQVILNLVVNAMEAMADTSGELRVVVIETALIESVVAEGRMVSVSVQDAGTGLDRDLQELMFEPFYTTKKTGMGMGLSISRSIVEAHGGRIWGKNNAGPGATFSFTLPYAGAEQA